MMTTKELEKNKNLNIMDVEIDKLTDVKDMKIEESLPKKERMLRFLEEYETPYFHKDGDVIVKNSFVSEVDYLEEKLAYILKKL